MNIIALLMIILLILMTAIGGIKGIRSFITLLLNFLVLFIMMLLIAFKIDPIKVTFISCIVICFASLFLTNGLHKKTIASLLSVISVIILVMLFTYRMGMRAEVQGYSNQQVDMISFYSIYIGVNFTKLVICEILVALLGAVIDVSVSISSSLTELLKNNPSISKKHLFRSGMNIGKDVLGTMTNTLFFAYISGFMTTLIYFYSARYTYPVLINT